MTGDQTHIPRSASRTSKRAADRPSASTVRRRLLAIAQDRLREVAGTDLAETWTKLANGWASCGWSTLFRNVATGTVVGLPDHCDKLACPCCELRRVGKVRDRYRERHDQALGERRIYLVTLTIPNVAQGELDAALRRLRKAIAKLRRRTWWADAVAGGLWRLEVTINLATRTWHPHANLLFETRQPIPMATWQPRIQADWRAVLGETEGQWIWLYAGWSGTLPETIKHQVSEARNASELDAARDGATSIDYTVKPDPHWIDASDPSWLVEYVETLSRARTVSSFGAWRGLPRPARQTKEQLVLAPYAVGDDPFADRYLPELDPLTSTPADWKFYGRGPRWFLRPVKPPGEDRQEWLVWRSDDGTLDPSLADDDTALVYQARLPLAPPAHD